MVLHSSVHLFQEGEFSHGLRDLLDIRDLLVFFSGDATFWPGLFSRARGLALDQPLFHALHHVDRLFGPIVPADYLHRVKDIAPGRVSRFVLSGSFSLALKPHHPSCDSLTGDFARWFVHSIALFADAFVFGGSPPYAQGPCAAFRGKQMKYQAWLSYSQESFFQEHCSD